MVNVEEVERFDGRCAQESSQEIEDKLALFQKGGWFKKAWLVLQPIWESDAIHSSAY